MAEHKLQLNIQRAVGEKCGGGGRGGAAGTGNEAYQVKGEEGRKKSEVIFFIHVKLDNNYRQSKQLVFRFSQLFHHCNSNNDGFTDEGVETVFFFFSGAQP